MKMNSTFRSKKKLSLALAALFTVMTLQPVAHANTYTVPNIMITEITPDTYTSSGVHGSPDAFEFIELYNNTSAAINLLNYRIIYDYGSNYYIWTISESKTIPAKGCFVLRTTTATATNALFRSNFDDVSETVLPDSLISVVPDSGLSNTASRTISIRAPGTGTTNICSASYDAENVIENVGIPYLYPTDASVEMRLLSTDTSVASPGTVFDGQVPPSSWDNTSPSQPGTITATPSGTQVTLAWASNTDSDLAFYRVYVDGTFYHTYRKTYTSCVVTGLSAGQNHTFGVSAVDTSNNGSAQSSVVTYTVPNIMITEITPDTHTSSGVDGSPDAFEFIELYNNTSSAINLLNYRIIYDYGSNYYTWTISESKTIPAKGCFVLRTTTDTTTNTLFRSNFNENSTTLPDSLISVVPDSGLSNTASRTISIRAPGTGTTNICSASYDAENVIENDGISYLYPTDASVDMRILSTDTSLASPGTVFDGQVPPTAFDNAAPSQPGTITATPGSGQVTLDWPENTDSDLALYRVYIDGTFYHTYRKTYTSCVVTGRTAETDYTFTVKAVDTSNNSSAASTVVSYSLAMALTAVNYVTTPNLFPDFFNISTAQAYIPGLAQDMVPQGLGFIPSSKWPAYSSGVYVIGLDRAGGGSSMLAFIDASNNTFIKSLVLYNSNRTAYTGHAGGVTVSEQNLWVASDSYLRRVPIADVVAAANRTKVFFADRFLATTSPAQFCFYSDGILWSGEFYHPNDSNYDTDSTHDSDSRDTDPDLDQHAWISGYDLDSTTDQLPTGKYVNDTTPVTPDYILSSCALLQGACRLSDGRIVLSRSAGVDSSLYPSQFRFYENVLEQTPHSTRSINGSTVPLWFLDEVSQDSVLYGPPMSEGIYQTESGYMTVVFESGATEYNSDTGACPVDNLYKVNISGQ